MRELLRWKIVGRCRRGERRVVDRVGVTRQTLLLVFCSVKVVD